MKQARDISRGFKQKAALDRLLAIFFCWIIKHLLNHNFALENSWPWPLQALEGFSDVCTTVQSALSYWEFGLDPSMA